MIRAEENTIGPRRYPMFSSNFTKQTNARVFKITDEDTVANGHYHKLGNQIQYTQDLNDVLFKKQTIVKQPKPRRTLINQIVKYCKNSTLHGLRYVGDSQLTFCERIFWFISFILAIIFAANYIDNIYAKWKSSPVIISFSPSASEISSIPFPAVTICNMNQAKKHEAEKVLKQGSSIEKKYLEHLCNEKVTYDIVENVSSEYPRAFLIRVGSSCSDMLKSCQWGARDISCATVFNNELTDEGLCCSFNRLPPEKIFRNFKGISIFNESYPSKVYDWNAEKGYDGNKIDDSVPRRPVGAGAQVGLTLILDARVDEYYCSSTCSIGFKVILASPIETPKMADFGILISPGYETRITIEPSIKEAAGDLRQIPIGKRQCYFVNERPLKYFRSYTKLNCLQECLANHTFKGCGCIPDYLPKLDNRPFCGPAKKTCIERKKIDVYDYSNGSYLIEKCNCKPACFEISYKSRTSRTPVYLHRLKERYNIQVQDDRSHSLAILQFLLNEPLPQTQVKSLLYGFSEILSNFGGILSLCLGISFLSVIELTYFFSLKLLCSYLRKS